jgi:diguanylate cyclase (GGDEF)-like protein/PAS domain S-box-containing protein
MTADDGMTTACGEPGSSQWASADDVRVVLERAHDALIAMDGDGLVIDWNLQAQRTFGWSSEEAVGRVLADLIIPARYRAAHWEGLRRHLDTGAATVLDKRFEHRAIDRTGREFPVELTISRHPKRSPPRFYAFLHDISERKLSERLVRAQHAITRVFAEAQSTGEAMSVLLAELGEAMDWQLGAWWSHETDTGVLRCRSVWRRGPAVAPEFEQVSLDLRLLPGDGLPGRVWVSGEPSWTSDLAADHSFPRSDAAARAGLHTSVCVPVLGDRGFLGAIEFLSDQTGEPDHGTREILSMIATQVGRFVALLTQRSELIAKLERLAMTDEMTGLANRRAWDEGLERELARARRHDQPLCVAMLDIDHFKHFNDTHGHQAGDRLLCDMAHMWRSQLRATDILARYGGEEFAVLIATWPIGLAETVLERLRDATPEGLTCSAGLAAFDGSETAEALVARADQALYEAKARGRDRTAIATAEQDRHTD